MEKRGWIQNKYLIKAYLKEISFESSNRNAQIKIVIFYSLAVFGFKKRVLKNKFRRAHKVN